MSFDCDELPKNSSFHVAIRNTLCCVVILTMDMTPAFDRAGLTMEKYYKNMILI